MAVHEATTGFLAQLAESGAKPITEMTPREARGFMAMLADFVGPGPEMASVRDEELATAGRASADAISYIAEQLSPRLAAR